jgi:hypothetical protein
MRKSSSQSSSAESESDRRLKRAQMEARIAQGVDPSGSGDPIKRPRGRAAEITEEQLRALPRSANSKENTMSNTTHIEMNKTAITEQLNAFIEAQGSSDPLAPSKMLPFKSNGYVRVLPEALRSFMAQNGAPKDLSRRSVTAALAKHLGAVQKAYALPKAVKGRKAFGLWIIEQSKVKSAKQLAELEKPASSSNGSGSKSAAKKAASKIAGSKGGSRKAREAAGESTPGVKVAAKSSSARKSATKRASSSKRASKSASKR